MKWHKYPDEKPPTDGVYLLYVQNLWTGWQSYALAPYEEKDGRFDPVYILPDSAKVLFWAEITDPEPDQQVAQQSYEEIVRSDA